MSGVFAGRLCTMREKSTAKLILNNFFAILKLFTVFGQKVTLSNIVNYKTYSLTSVDFVCCTDTVHIEKKLL